MKSNTIYFPRNRTIPIIISATNEDKKTEREKERGSK